MDTVFSLWYHGPHPVTGETEDGRAVIGMDNKEFHLDIVERARGGQVDIHFCSASCVSTFFSEVAARLAEGIEETEKPNKRPPGNAGQ